MDEARKLEMERARRRLINAYSRTFGTEDGQVVLQDLAARFGLEAPVFHPVQQAGHFGYDPLTAALTDGGRGVIIYIRKLLEIPYTGDGNLEKPKTKVTRGSRKT